ncbi:MAG TPA: hypothetical protein VKE91_08980 [Blastocatellia bacterium]|nr:hypothetical protein [Blastocatellia bacterium]
MMRLSHTRAHRTAALSVLLVMLMALWNGLSAAAASTPAEQPKRVTYSLGDQLGCIGPGDTVPGTFTMTNSGAAPTIVTATVAIQTGLSALPGTCAANVGNCSIVNPSAIKYTATLAVGQSATVDYLLQISDQTPMGAHLCSTLSVIFGGGQPVTVDSCVTVDCPPVGPGSVFPTASEISDQKAGSILIYNIYTSDPGSPRAQDTRINLTNTDPARSVVVHLFLIDGSSCTAADSFICLSPNQTASFMTSDFDPGVTGYIVAVASDRTIGCPINFNHLIGDAYVKFASGHATNLGAEAISAIAGGAPFCNQNSMFAQINFDGVSYSRIPRALALDNIPSRADGNDTMIILNPIGGALTSGVAKLSGVFGVFYDDAETPLSFTFNPNVCQFRSSITNNFPRIAPRFEAAVPSGRSGWLRLYSLTDLGILGAAINFNPNAAGAAGSFNQGHNLHKLTLTSAASYNIPIVAPGCL